MIKQNKWKLIIASAVIILPMIVGFIFMRVLPEQMSVHWDVWGNADGYAGPVAFVTLIPLVLLVAFWLGILLSAKDNKRSPQNAKVINMILWIIPFMSLYISAIMYAIAFGFDINISAISLVVMGILFIVIGNYLPKCTRNRTIGIRIKWTLENDDNWNKTHRFGGKVFVISGIVALLAAFLPSTFVPFALLSIVILNVALTGIYSYCYYKKQLKSGEYIEEYHEEDEAERSSKRTVIFSIIMTLAVLVFCGVLIFTGKVEIELTDTSLVADATYNKAFVVDYCDIESVEYLEDHDAGSRVVGFGSPKIGVGHFESEKFGSYTRYANTQCRACIVIKTENETLVINGKDATETKQIYEELTEKLAAE